MAFEYKMLILMSLIFLAAWLPVSIAKWKSFGAKWLASNRAPLSGKELLPWGARAERAHNNLKDNFPAFVAAILLLGILDQFDYLTAWASGLYVAARLIHYASYMAGNVAIRFLSYLLALSSNGYLLLRPLL